MSNYQDVQWTWKWLIKRWCTYVKCSSSIPFINSFRNLVNPRIWFSICSLRTVYWGQILSVSNIRSHSDWWDAHTWSARERNRLHSTGRAITHMNAHRGQKAILLYSRLSPTWCLITLETCFKIKQDYSCQLWKWQCNPTWWSLRWVGDWLPPTPRTNNRFTKKIIIHFLTVRVILRSAKCLHWLLCLCIRFVAESLRKPLWFTRWS